MKTQTNRTPGHRWSAPLLCAIPLFLLAGCGSQTSISGVVAPVVDSGKPVKIWKYEVWATEENALKQLVSRFNEDLAQRRPEYEQRRETEAKKRLQDDIAVAEALASAAKQHSALKDSLLAVNKQLQPFRPGWDHLAGDGYAEEFLDPSTEIDQQKAELRHQFDEAAKSYKESLGKPTPSTVSAADAFRNRYGTNGTAPRYTPAPAVSATAQQQSLAAYNVAAAKYRLLLDAITSGSITPAPQTPAVWLQEAKLRIKRISLMRENLALKENAKRAYSSVPAFVSFSYGSDPASFMLVCEENLETVRRSGLPRLQPPGSAVEKEWNELTHNELWARIRGTNQQAVSTQAAEPLALSGRGSTDGKTGEVATFLFTRADEDGRFRLNLPGGHAWCFFVIGHRHPPGEVGADYQLAKENYHWFKQKNVTLGHTVKFQASDRVEYTLKTQTSGLLETLTSDNSDACLENILKQKYGLKYCHGSDPYDRSKQPRGPD